MSTITKPITVSQYKRMIEDGRIGEDERVELIEGRLVAKMTKKPDHSTSSENTWRQIHALLPVGWHVRIEKPVCIPNRDSMPEPDISVARGSSKDYASRDPEAKDVALVVEISRSSLADDRALATTYGAGGILVYWIVNLVDRQVELYAEPAAGRYQVVAIHDEASSVDLVIDDQQLGRIAVADLLP
jgi:Uma2 family endonuclease